MHGLREIKKRLKAVEGTKKIIGVMKLIAASKLKGAQEDAVGARLYNEKLKSLAMELSSKCGDSVHPAFESVKEIKKILLIVFSTDKGFCGALNDHMVMQVVHFIQMMEDRGIGVTTWIIGSKGRTYFKKYGFDVTELDKSSFKDAEPAVVYDGGTKLLSGISIQNRDSSAGIHFLSQYLLGVFLSGGADQVLIAYNRFRSVTSQQVVMDMFLPIWVKKADMPEFRDKVDFLYEPCKSLVVEKIIEEVLDCTFLQALREARTSEIASRLVTMDRSFKNAGDMEKLITREHNRARQAAITREIMGIISGAEALEGSTM